MVRPSRRVNELTSAELETLPDPCAGCVHWELGGPAPSPRAATTEVRKCAWWRSVELGEVSGAERGCVPGRALNVDGELAGWSLAAPARAFPRRPGLAPVPSSDSLLLATAWIEPAHRGQGYGRLLLHAAVKEAIRLDLEAVEALGDRRHRDNRCMLPGTWLLHEGFAVHREHPRTPLFRLDVSRLARWAEPLGHALETAMERVGRRSEPEPVPQRANVTPRSPSP